MISCAVSKSINRPPRLRDVTIDALASFPRSREPAGLIPHPLGSRAHGQRSGEPAGFKWPLFTRWVHRSTGFACPWPAPLGSMAGGIGSGRPGVTVASAPAAAWETGSGSDAPGRAGGEGPAAAVASRTIFYFFKLTHYPLGSFTQSCTHPISPL